VNTVVLEIVTPDKTFPAQEVISIDVPAETGRLAILARHQPMVCLLKAGVLNVVAPDGERAQWTIGAGTLSVTDGTAALLVRSASPPSAPIGPPESRSPSP